MKYRILLGALAYITLASAALAHHPNIEADAVCVDGNAVINYRSYSWVLEPGFEQYLADSRYGSNPAIEISLDGTPVDTGAYSMANNYQFTGSYPVSGGTSVVVTALAVGDWATPAPGGQSASTYVYLPDDCTPPLGEGRFTGGGSQIRVDGVRVTRGLTIHCDLLLSNNLEINWAGGNRFHMEEHMTTVVCSDDPDIIQAPPPAPLDTLVGTGAGRFNGESGYTVVFKLQDFGEPGRNDQMEILITEDATGDVVLSVPLQKLSGGNLQAHYDQPHR